MSKNLPLNRKSFLIEVERVSEDFFGRNCTCGTFNYTPWSPCNGHKWQLTKLSSKGI